MPITTPEQLALARRVRDHLAAHPDEHNQGTWYCTVPECGTVACIAGWTAVFDGAEPILSGRSASYVRTKTGITQYIADYARAALGLGESEANGIFNSDNEEAVGHLEDLIANAEQLLMATAEGGE